MDASIATVIAAALAALATLGSAFLLSRNPTQRPLTEPEAIIESKDRQLKAVQADLQRCRDQLDELRGL